MCDDECSGPTSYTSPAGAGAPRIVQRCDDGTSRCLPGWNETAQNRAAQTDDGEVREDGAVNREAQPVPAAPTRRRSSRRSGCRRTRARGRGHPQPRQHETLDQQLTDDTPTACAECEADRDIAFTLGGPRQQEIRCVGAGDEQHEGHRAEERDHDSQNRRSDSGSERFDAWCRVPIAGRIVFGEGGRDARQLRRRLLVAHARSQATDAFQQAVTPRRSCVFRERDERYRISARRGKPKPCGMTPMMVDGTPSTRIVLPNSLGSERYRVRQRASPSITTGAAPGLSSASENSRPSAGRCRMSVNVSQDTYAPRTRTAGRSLSDTST